MTGIERFNLIKFANAAPVSGDEDDRTSLIEQLGAGASEWDWDIALHRRPFPAEDFAVEHILTMTKDTIRYAVDFIGKLAKGIPMGSGVFQLSGGQVRYLVTLRSKMEDELRRRLPPPSDSIEEQVS